MMRRRGWISIGALLIGCVGVTAHAQRGGFGPGFGGPGVGGPGFGGPGFGPGFGGKPVTGEPYTASSISTSKDKLGDGTTISRSSTSTEARDTDGRTVFSTTVTEAGGKLVTRTTVTDPVAHTVTSWSSLSTIATQFQLPTPPAGGRGDWSGRGGPGPGGSGPGGRGPGGRGGTDTTKVTLSPKTIAGDSATGVKFTTTIPAGAEGNDKPLVSTRELWTSTDLKIPLLEISDSPREGFHKMEVTSLSQGSPDVTLFQVPANYTLRVESRHGRGGR